MELITALASSTENCKKKNRELECAIRYGLFKRTFVRIRNDDGFIRISPTVDSFRHAAPAPQQGARLLQRCHNVRQAIFGHLEFPTESLSFKMQTTISRHITHPISQVLTDLVSIPGGLSWSSSLAQAEHVLQGRRPFIFSILCIRCESRTFIDK